MPLIIFDTETLPDELVLLLYNAYKFDDESVFITARNIPKDTAQHNPRNINDVNDVLLEARCTVLMNHCVIKDIERRICHAIGVVDGMNATQSSESLFRSAMAQCRPETCVIGHRNTILMHQQRELAVVVAITCPHREPFVFGARRVVFIDTMALCNWLISQQKT